ncbi:MAG: hypothetical protein CEN89_348 [Candidatus Berkelbacteria bacterium Licking1014_7]|uniref:Uncharacterized protein n=1 Tax=Candidatus Berkelbacteria bacterium Licking1014_7 TaxID=2017147 RepID=A0A554LJC8_9BACT|nr:MAG: hypothetical protein CEN89_348 [Candidatus Berkelbacteria bacterium Licking1014_7]
MKNNHFGQGIVMPILVIILSVIILTGISIGVFYLVKIQQDNNTPPEAPVIEEQTDETDAISGEIPTSETIPADPTADWKTYTNEKYGFSFKYPENHFIIEYHMVDESTNRNQYYIGITDDKNKKSLGNEDCPTKYFVMVEGFTGLFNNLANQSSYPTIDNFQTKIIKVDSHETIRLSGIFNANTSSGSKIGDNYNSAIIKLGNANKITFDICSKYNGDIIIFDQILSTLKFTE